MNVAYVTNIAPPYRIPLFKKLQESGGNDFHFIFCTRREGNRNWDVTTNDIDAIFLSEQNIKTKDGYNYIHNNTNILTVLWRINPDVVIITGLNPTMLYAFLYCTVSHKKLIYMTDGNIESEKDLDFVHRLIRKLVFRECAAFIGMNRKAEALFLSYDIPRRKIFRSQLCVDNCLYRSGATYDDRDIDLLFCGQLHERKMPYFFLDVFEEVYKFRDIRARIIGDGPLKDSIISRISHLGGDCKYIGSLQPQEIIRYYGRSKILCFPTRHDSWGMVANEAMASGVPVITTPQAGVANELVLDGINGFVLEPNVKRWTNTIVDLLVDPVRWQRFSSAARKEVAKYNYDEAAKGILDAIGSL